MTRAVARLLAALAAGMIASGLLGATAHAQSTPAESPKAAKVQPAMTEAGKVLTGIDVLAASGFAPLDGTARRPSDQPGRSHQVRAEHHRRAGGRTGRYARRVVQPRAWPRRRPRGRHRIAARCAHRPARSQSLRHHTASARLHAGRASTPSSSTCRTWACASTPTPPPWPTSWRRRRSGKLKVFVLDRPNPIGAAGVRGPLPDPDVKSFTNYFRLPVQHGMTLGELAPPVQCGAAHRRRPDRDRHAGLRPRRPGTTRPASPGWRRRPTCVRSRGQRSIRASA